MSAAALLTAAAFMSGSATAYAPCEGGGSAGQTASGKQLRVGYVANNILPLGTWIELSKPVQGRRFYVVEDRIGWGSDLDIYMESCAAMHAFGRRTVRYRAVPKGELYRGKPMGGWRLVRGKSRARLVWRP